jgi:hypothetical protein
VITTPDIINETNGLRARLAEEFAKVERAHPGEIREFVTRAFAAIEAFAEPYHLVFKIGILVCLSDMAQMGGLTDVIERILENDINPPEFPSVEPGPNP